MNRFAVSAAAFLVCAVQTLIPAMAGAAPDITRTNVTDVLDNGLTRIMFGLSFSEVTEPYSADKRYYPCENPETIFRPLDSYDEPGDYLYYDRANGFMQMVYNPAPCGCVEESRAAAYARQDGGYLFLKDTYSFCKDRETDGITASAGPEEIFPSGFGLGTFLPEGYVLPPTDQAGFLLRADIPQTGTDTGLRLERIPFGLYSPNTDMLRLFVDETPALDEDAALSDGPLCVHGEYDPVHYEIERTVRILFDQEVFTNDAYSTDLPKHVLITLLLNGDIGKIGDRDRGLLEYLGRESDGNATLVSLEHLSERLRFFYKMYMVERALVADRLLLGWDKHAGRFFIKKAERTRPAPESFSDFLLNNSYFHRIC